MEKNTKKKIPQEELIATVELSSSCFLLLTCFESQKITYHMKPAVMNIKIPSKSAFREVLPRAS